MPRESYHVDIGGRTIAFEWDGATLYRDGQPVAATLHRTGPDHFSLLFEGRSLRLSLEGRSNGTLSVRTRNGVRSVRIRDRRALLLEALGMDAERRSRQSALRAPMPGLIVTVHVAAGDVVRSGDPLIVLEAMKMENELRATEDAVVSEVHFEAGMAVGKNDLLIEFEQEPPQ